MKSNQGTLKEFPNVELVTVVKGRGQISRLWRCPFPARELFQSSTFVWQSLPRALPWAGIRERLRRYFEDFADASRILTPSQSLALGLTLAAASQLRAALCIAFKTESGRFS
jgi:hypothetical protein